MNPQFKTIAGFAEIFHNDKNTGKITSSRWAWAAACYASFYSEYFGLTEEDKLVKINRDLFERDNTVNIMKAIKPLIKEIEELEDTPERRQYRELCRIMDDRTTYLKKMKYNNENVEDMDKAFINTPKLYETLTKIKNLMEKEDIVGEKTRGGSKESLMETGELNID